MTHRTTIAITKVNTLIPHRFFQSLGRRERWRVAIADDHRLSRFWVASFPTPSVARLESSESYEIDFIPVCFYEKKQDKNGKNIENTHWGGSGTLTITSHNRGRSISFIFNMTHAYDARED